MYHYYLQKCPPSLIEIANSKPIERIFYYASMQTEMDEQKKGLESMRF